MLLTTLLSQHPEAALDIVRPLAEKDRGIYRSLKRTLWADLGRAFGLDL